MFKVGDTVVCVRGFECLLEGKTYTIGEAGSEISTVEELGNFDYWANDRFVLASEYSAAENLKEQSISRYLPDDDAQRRDYPLFDGLFAYFPNTLCEVSRWSKAGNEQHNPGEELHWAKDKSTDHKNKILRHLLDAEQVNSQGFYEAVGMAWRALALCEEILVASGKPWGPNVK